MSALKESEYHLSAFTADEQLIIKASLWERPDSYCGSQFFGTISLFGQSRDSDILEQSNHLTALNELGGETESVQVIRAAHWACGWVDSIQVAITNVAATKKACELIRSYESYPVLDESDYAERQSDYYSEFAEQGKDSVAKTIVKQFGLPSECTEDPDLLTVGYALHMEAQYDGGEYSCCNFNNEYVAEYCERDWIDLTDGLERLDDNGHLEGNPYYIFLCAALNIGGES